jgi:hypothetical protein
MDHFILDESALGEVPSPRHHHCSQLLTTIPLQEGYALATFDTALAAILAIDTNQVVSI